MIVCNKCGKENQDHYKFCLGCGSELSAAPPAPPAPAPAPQVRPPVVAAAPKKTAAPAHAVDPIGAAVSPTPPAGVPQVDEPVGDFEPQILTARGAGTSKPPAARQTPAPPPMVSPADLVTQPLEDSPAPAPAGGMSPCPSCGTPNPKEFVFCGNCGTRIQALAAPRTLNMAGGGKPAAKGEPRALAKLGLIRPDGTEGGIHMVRDEEAVIGRGTGPLFDHDAYLSPTHARLLSKDGGMILEDTGSLNGVFLKISAEEALRSGDIFRIGQELLRFDAILDPQLLEDGTEIMGSPNPGYWGRLSVIMGPGLDGSAFPLMGEEMVLGRERGDILFSDDGYVSGTHAKISIREDGYFLTDLGSSNGTFMRITEPRDIPTGSFVLMGQQLFRIELL